MRKLVSAGLCVATLTMLVGPMPALAEDPWSFQTIDDGQGGELGRLIGRLDDARVLYAECSASSAVLALVAVDLPYELGDVGLNLHVEIDGNDRMSTGEFFATEGGEGVAYTGVDYLEGLFRDLAAATSAVSMRIVDYSDGSDETWAALGLGGLAASAETFVSYCYGGGQPVATVASTEWSFSQTVADVEAGYRGVMTGLGSDGTAMRLTCSLDASVWTIGVVGPLVVAEGAARLAVDIEGLTWGFAAEAASGPAVIASGSTDIAELSTVFSLPREGVLVEVIAGSKRTPYRFTAGEPAAAAALEMFRNCYALR